MPNGPALLHSHASASTREALLCALPLLGSSAAEAPLGAPARGDPDIVALGFPAPSEEAKSALRLARASFPRSRILLIFERASSDELDLFCRLGAEGAWSLPLPSATLAGILRQGPKPDLCHMPPADLALAERERRLRAMAVSGDLPSAIIDLAQDFATQDPEDLARAEASLLDLAAVAFDIGLPELERRARELAALSRRSIAQGSPAPSVSDALALLAHANIPSRARPAVLASASEPPERLIFIADPDEEHSRRLAESLRKIGYPAERFPSPLAAALAAKSRAPAALIVDESLCSGCSDPRLDPVRSLPKIMVGGSGEFASLLKAASVGALSCVPRGSDSAAIAAALDSIFRQESSDPLDVLVVEGDPAAEARLLLLLGKAGMSARVARSGPEAVEALRERRADLVLVDLLLPDCPGGLLARVIRLQPESIGVPLYFLAGPGESSIAREAVAQGGDGIVDEILPDAEIAACALAAAERSRRVSSAMALEGLTGLLLHTYAADAIRRAFSESRRTGSPCSLAMLDIDRFKSVNDRFGHPVGDRVLRALSSIISRSMRGDDLAGRYGGEEFVILLPNCSRDDAVAKVESILEAFRAVVFEASGSAFTCSFSAGVASSEPFSSHEDMLLAADEALYRAKRAGRDRVLPAEPLP